MANTQTLNSHTFRECIRTHKNDWFQHKAEEAERYSQEKNHRSFYVTLNVVYSPKTKSLYPVRTKNGELLTSRDKIKDRWVEHFSDDLNLLTEVDFSMLEDTEYLIIE